MDLNTALRQIAETYDLKADDLIAYAAEDTIGGYHADPNQSKWHIGSVWGVDGQVIYALIRATKPRFLLNLGVLYGCSLTHTMAAVRKNMDENPRYRAVVTGVDLNTPAFLPDGAEFLGMNALEYIETAMPENKVDFLFEDFMHGIDSVRRVWQAFHAKARKNAFIISHDATHYLAGKDVRLGIVASGVLDPLILAIEPSDCGLAVWRKP